MRPILPVLAALVLLPACAVDKEKYPSLARRPIERQASESPAPAPSATPAAPSAEQLARIEQLLVQVHKADTAFRAEEPRTRQLVGAAVGSAVAAEQWSEATVALASLEAARSDAMVALAELDALYAAGTVAGDDVGAVAQARAEVTALVGRQDDVLAELRGRMPT
jgi:hypothetical protein